MSLERDPPLEGKIAFLAREEADPDTIGNDPSASDEKTHW
eukprot:CAMPEP_0170559694 /NCGR_PEP_ID=MMETSP0211-20121228/44513_1 /TAXON_ID=311385 /ORGANISM="Pseudokeronopsis sp., Strain OXSARD2" /LENGTH=39 /DNA_ID= /DNA_START= /DNA_END= /DNA_ORIENTATION=